MISTFTTGDSKFIRLYRYSTDLASIATIQLFNNKLYFQFFTFERRISLKEANKLLEAYAT